MSYQVLISVGIVILTIIIIKSLNTYCNANLKFDDYIIATILSGLISLIIVFCIFGINSETATANKPYEIIYEDTYPIYEIVDTKYNQSVVMFRKDGSKDSIVIVRDQYDNLMTLQINPDTTTIQKTAIDEPYIEIYHRRFTTPVIHHSFPAEERRQFYVIHLPQEDN